VCLGSTSFCLSAADIDSDDLDVKWNSFFFDFDVSDDTLSFLADMCAFFLRPFIAALSVFPVDNPSSNSIT